MRSPEEVALDAEAIARACLRDPRSVGQEALNRLIRARDAEVRAEVDRIALTLSVMTTQGMAEVERIAEVAATLVGLMWEPGFRDDRGRDHALPPGDGPEDVPRVFTRTRRLVGPWEPVEP